MDKNSPDCYVDGCHFNFLYVILQPPSTKNYVYKYVSHHVVWLLLCMHACVEGITWLCKKAGYEPSTPADQLLEVVYVMVWTNTVNCVG